jgi:predicted NUDIX family NTP pyrophosphohydrolase
MHNPTPSATILFSARVGFTMFRSSPLCEVCKRRAATAIVGFRQSGEQAVTAWQFTCSAEISDSEAEAFSINEFLASADATVGQLAVLHESGRVDWKSFMDMVVRLRAASRPTAV